MKRCEFIEKCCNVLDKLNVTEYAFKFEVSRCELVFEYEHPEFHKIMDVLLCYFPYSYFLKRKLNYNLMCIDKHIVIRFFEEK